jgi:hypothetical protein
VTSVFCPSCRSEFRPGFTRCGRCEVDLVAQLGPARETTAPPTAPVTLAEYCGFLDLDEARATREQLREASIACDIVIRDAPTEPSGPVREEYWLRVDRERYREVHAIVGEPETAVVAETEDELACGSCGQPVAVEETFCANCGARFDEA